MHSVTLTLVMQNKLRFHTHFYLPADQITWCKLLMQIRMLNDKQCRTRSVGFWRYTVFEGRTYPGSAGPGLNYLQKYCLTEILKFHFNLWISLKCVDGWMINVTDCELLGPGSVFKPASQNSDNGCTMPNCTEWFIITFIMSPHLRGGGRGSYCFWCGSD